MGTCPEPVEGVKFMIANWKWQIEIRSHQKSGFWFDKIIIKYKH